MVSLHVLRLNCRESSGGGGPVGCQRRGCSGSAVDFILAIPRRLSRWAGTAATHVASNLGRFRHCLRINPMHVDHTPRGTGNLTLISAAAAVAPAGDGVLLPLGCPPPRCRCLSA